MLGLAARSDVALDVRELLGELDADLAIVDCMLPRGLAGAEAARVRRASVIHFFYGLARRAIAAGDAWTTDLPALQATRRALDLRPVDDALQAWDAVDLMLVPAPHCFDVDAGFRPHVVHAGPLGLSGRRPSRRGLRAAEL